MNLKDGKTTFGFKKGDSKALAKKIDQILSGKMDTTSVTDFNYERSMIEHDVSTLTNDMNKLLDFSLF